jgi:hypothetical protein
VESEISKCGLEDRDCRAGKRLDFIIDNDLGEIDEGSGLFELLYGRTEMRRLRLAIFLPP